MVSVEKKCGNCYHQRKMSCPSSENCYSKPDKPFWVLGKPIEIAYSPTLREKIVRFFKKLKGE